MFDESENEPNDSMNFRIVDEDFMEAGVGEVVDEEVASVRVADPEVAKAKPVSAVHANPKGFSPSSNDSNNQNDMPKQDDSKPYGAAYSDDYEFASDPSQRVVEPEVVNDNEEEQTHQDMQYMPMPSLLSARNLTMAALVLAGGFMIYSSMKSEDEYEYEDEEYEDEEYEDEIEEDEE